MTSFLDAFNELYRQVNKKTNETVTECITNIPDDKFHLWLLLPSSLMIILLAFSFHRKNLRLSCLGGRPAAVFPMDILGKSNRMSYAAAWGSITFLTMEMIFEKTVIVDLHGPTYVTIWNKILSIMIIGIDYYPMFAALALESLVSLVVAAAYVFMLFIVNLYKIFECDLIPIARLILIARDLPNLVCLGYLCVSIPMRIIQGLRTKTVSFYTSSEMVALLNTKDLDLTPEAEHVRDLFRPPRPPPSPPGNLQEKIKEIAKGVIDVVIYHNKHKYRYSSRILTVTVMGLILLYYVAVELFVEFLPLFYMIDKGFESTTDIINSNGTTSEEQSITEVFVFLQELVQNSRFCYIVSLTFTIVAGILSILHMLASYRTNLLALYKGDNTHIPHRSTMENKSLLVGSMRFAGYQVAYIAWGFMLHLFCFFMASIALCVLIMLLMRGISGWLLEILETMWPALMITTILVIVQNLLSTFFFLQGRGLYLAIDNRRGLFSFSFFMFFYNIFIGFLSCLLRIIKSVVIGAVFLPRLDNSALPRRFQMMDPECSHTHPVVLMFVRILMAGKKKRDESIIDPEKSDVTKEKALAFVRARIRWQTAYSILKNPALRALRKSQIDRAKEMLERLSQLYHLDKNQTCELMSQITKAGIDLKDVNDAVESEQSCQKLPFTQNWYKALKIHSFMQKITRERELGLGIFANQHQREDRNEQVDFTENNEGTLIVQTPSTRWKLAKFLAVDLQTKGQGSSIQMSDIQSNV
ncbi:stimulated by retinoic acid gene 6 protein-like isoform X2 [Dreissena polymorpha]|uniref:stimulated by retinoic acid gene 6 protein-like isoform X2 n=1 Tax=Dreissena polymorpha TaxID=45954 RepID=UPI00226503DC|nr:stimulated by retinoic acid gene 6 protein-like isoform X2 [Dreissena polymorpha]